MKTGVVLVSCDILEFFQLTISLLYVLRFGCLALFGLFSYLVDSSVFLLFLWLAVDVTTLTM